MTTKQLRSRHTALLQAEQRGEYLKPVLTDLSRLVTEATDYAADLERQLAEAAENPAEFMAKHRMIAHVWGVEDVKEARDDLTDDQAWEVLKAADSKLDSDQGLCWETFETLADEMFPAGTEMKTDNKEIAA